jgi:hypothetical protein|tara:strand:+ start:456 stop:563 length:108 start_codon:yes stop_codon:yes gene_type:complete
VSITKLEKRGTDGGKVSQLLLLMKEDLEEEEEEIY